MSWRIVVVTGCAKLDYKMDYLVVRKQDDINRIYLGEISTLIVDSTMVSLTSMLLCELIKKKIKVIFCDKQHSPHFELMPYYGSHDTSLKIKNQINWLFETKQMVWTSIVSEKIGNQMKVLNHLGFVDQAALLDGYIKEITLGDETNREGHAAKVYFNALFGMDFARRSDHPLNAILNYGYSIMLSSINREVVVNGYLTQLGLFHDNMFNQFNLSSDLIEPYRVLVDLFVLKTMPDELTPSIKSSILDILNQEVVIDEKTNTVANSIKIYCRSVFSALNDNNIHNIRFFKYEL